MSTFKQKNIIKSYKLRLQEKLKTITEETDKASNFLNSCVSEFRSRVDHILEIKDEKCLSLYRKLIRDLESYSEKIFILQASIGEVTEDESECSEDEHVEVKLPRHQLQACCNDQPQTESHVTVPSIVQEDVNPKLGGLDNNEEDSITEDDFCSIRSVSIQNTNSASLNSQVDSCHIQHVANSKYESNISASQNSCYCSISSDSESSAFHGDKRSIRSLEVHSQETKDESLLELSRDTLTIHPTVVEVSTNFSATLSCIIDPGNFWVQIENSHSSNVTFPKSESGNFCTLSSIKEGSYCLAPFKSTSFYYRAQSLSEAKSEKEKVKVLFIDHGSIQDIYLCDLRSLPASAYSISAQAIHCYLYGIVPKDSSWSKECIERFKDFQNCCIETLVKSKENLYGVELVAKLAADLDDDFSVDIAQALCSDGLAASINESPELNISFNQQSETTCKKADSLELSGSYTAGAISSDSGVSVSSFKKSSNIDTKKNENFSEVSVDYISPGTVKNSSIIQCDRNLVGFNHNTQIKDLILFDSFDALEELQNSSEKVERTNSSCLICKKKDFCWHLKISSPSLSFVEKDMVIVMLSHIVNPNEFYVNMAIENIITLDDLREQMTALYESQPNLHHINVEDIWENMFCAGRFAQDKYWYRIKILRIFSEDRVLVQYVDYGNVDIIKCHDMQPLTQKFSQPPVFALKCSLAGVTPISKENSEWSEDAINEFKKLTSYERCLTAEICNESCMQSDIYPVLLWDTEDSQDMLINSLLAEHKVAIFDYTLVHSSTSDQTAIKPCTDMDAWDPMLEEYNQTENSYGVNDEDIEVATTGYQAKDEKYTCKYFSLRGYCPRGVNCPYDHQTLLETGVTRDQEEVYCVETSPIISKDVSNILVQVSAVVTPGHFYVVLPFGCKTVDEIDELVYKGIPHSEIVNSEAKALFYALDMHYSKTPFQENTTISLSCGTIVVAKRKWDGKWHRGRVVDVVGVDKPAKIFFVDAGDQEWVPRKLIRTILPQFLHTPFQAVHCSLHEIDPVGYENGLSWSTEAVNYFKDIVADGILLAETVHRIGPIFHVSLKKTSQDNHQSIGQLLVSAGYAQFNNSIPLDYKKIRYVPG